MPPPPAVPPVNFGMVDMGIYRSSLPGPESFEFFQSIRLKSIVYLCPEPYSEESAAFIRSQGIRLFQFGMEGKKDSSLAIPKEKFMEALMVLLDIRNHPLLIHCRQGKHRTGRLVGCFRKVQGWRLAAIAEEYVNFAAPKVRLPDLEFIERFDVKDLADCVSATLYRYHGRGRRALRIGY